MEVVTNTGAIDPVIENILVASRSFIYRCDNDLDVTMRYLLGNVRQITGYRKDQLLNSREVKYASLCHPEDVDILVGQVDRAIDICEPWDVDYRLIRPDGSVILVRERGEAVRDNKGNVQYLHGLVIDATTEHTLRTELEQNSFQVKAVNDEILVLAAQITRSIRALKMLSINARIEAARAGDAGLGFAVVADEINKLATANADWAGQIANRMSK